MDHFPKRRKQVIAKVSIAMLTGFFILCYEQETAGISPICFLHCTGRVLCMVEPAKDQSGERGEAQRSNCSRPSLGIFSCITLVAVKPLDSCATLEDVD